jgi:hypothetical protein
MALVQISIRYTVANEMALDAMEDWFRLTLLGVELHDATVHQNYILLDSAKS